MGLRVEISGTSLFFASSNPVDPTTTLQLPGWLVVLYYIAGIVLGVAAILGGVRWIMRRIIPMIRAVDQFLDDWHGEPGDPKSGRPEVPGMMLRVRNLEETTTYLKNEVTANGGQSIKDQINRIDKRVAKMESSPHEKD